MVTRAGFGFDDDLDVGRKYHITTRRASDQGDHRVGGHRRISTPRPDDIRTVYLWTKRRCIVDHLVDLGPHRFGNNVGMVILHPECKTVDSSPSARLRKLRDLHADDAALSASRARL